MWGEKCQAIFIRISACADRCLQSGLMFGLKQNTFLTGIKGAKLQLWRTKHLFSLLCKWSKHQTHSHSWKGSRPGWTGLRATWASGKCSCPWQGVGGMGWALGSLPTQTFLGFYGLLFHEIVLFHDLWSRMPRSLSFQLYQNTPTGQLYLISVMGCWFHATP